MSGYDFEGEDRRRQVPCSEHEKRIALTEQAVSSLKATNEGITTKLDLILGQIMKIALLEQKHQDQEKDVSRAHDKISKLDSKLDVLSVEIRDFVSHTKGQNKILWLLVPTVFALFVKVVFFAASNGMAP